mmetsp:Transcript_5699/g.14236  ORF Transcript_5699/g.14236 Transcript_5699/m.14236 type:complete len:187 (+) Transcript_5699:110-670(+)
MISSTLVKCSIAIVMLVHVQVSAFISPSTSAGRSNSVFSAAASAATSPNPTHGLDRFHPVQLSRDIGCYATKKGQNRPGKTAFDGKSNVGGIGGLNMNIYKTGKNIASSAPKPKNNTTKISIKNKTKITNKKVNNTKSTGSNISEPTKTSWSSIILAFLTPWRNPNSIFLYLLIIVNVLGTLNADK